MSVVGGQVLPIYFVADESGSMGSVVGEMNVGLRSLHDALQLESMAAAKVRFGIIGFDDAAVCHLDLCDLRTLDKMPTLSARGSTAYTAAFRDLRSRIDRDVTRLKSEGYAVHRPAVFFLSDGQPDADGWESALAELKSESFKRRPNIVAFGIGGADPATIVKVASKPEFAFQAAVGSDTGVAIAKFLETLTNSVVSSGQALASGKGELPIEKPDGFVMAVDLLD